MSSSSVFTDNHTPPSEIAQQQEYMTVLLAMQDFFNKFTFEKITPIFC